MALVKLRVLSSHARPVAPALGSPGTEQFCPHRTFFWMLLDSVIFRGPPSPESLELGRCGRGEEGAWGMRKRHKQGSGAVCQARSKVLGVG